MDIEFEDVREFHQKFDILNNDTPTMLTKRKLLERIECMQEELDEFKKAVEAQDFPEQADALIDLVYFAKGTGVMMGLPWDELWDDVQRANMAKVRGVGKRGHAVDMIKPEGWQKPNGEAILKAAGWDIDMYTDDEGNVQESLCADDPFRKELLDKVIALLLQNNNVKLGPGMSAPVMKLADGREIQAVTRAAPYTEEMTLRAPELDGKTIHMLGAEVRHFGPQPAFDAETLQPTGEIMPPHSTLYIRFGVSD